MSSWKDAWKNCEMDQRARAEKRSDKKRQHKTNRKHCNDNLKKGNYDEEDVLDWKDLNDKDRK